MGFFDKKSESNVACVEKIKKFLKETGTGMGFMSNGSVKAVAQMIQPEEKILYVVCANVSMGEPKGKLDLNTFKFKNKLNGVVVLTNQRVVFGASSGYSASKVFYLTDIKHTAKHHKSCICLHTSTTLFSRIFLCSSSFA